MLEMGMERVEEGTTDVGGSWKSVGRKLIPVESPGIGYSQEAVLEDTQTLKFSDVFINSWESNVSAKEIIAGISLEIPDVASFATLEVCLSESLALLRIYSGSETIFTGGPLGFALVLGLLEDTLFQWSFQLDDYN